jgi:hypothetical protein
MPEYLVKALLSLLIGVVSFGLARLFHVGAAVSVVIGGVTAAGTFVSRTLGFAKKCLETRKLWLENKKLSREAEAAQKLEVDKARLIRLATTEEIGKFGVCALERRINV